MSASNLATLLLSKRQNNSYLFKNEFFRKNLSFITKEIPDFNFCPNKPIHECDSYIC